ncbi:hypothetical protein TRIUR3_34853 [Triticum urartu]|uniref:Uncharacterized protein n=1 Tax=Triticum urartu TaxID=4572 RepID=M7ZGM5_TRIUA|nr:hypothetical protein TRIUR3_34853 [Triticum urartu]
MRGKQRFSTAPGNGGLVALVIPRQQGGRGGLQANSQRAAETKAVKARRLVPKHGGARRLTAGDQSCGRSKRCEAAALGARRFCTGRLGVTAAPQWLEEERRGWPQQRLEAPVGCCRSRVQRDKSCGSFGKRRLVAAETAAAGGGSERPRRLDRWRRARWRLRNRVVVDYKSEPINLKLMQIIPKRFFFVRKITNSLIPGRDPSKNSIPPCASPTVGANYRGIVTADILQ